MKAQKLLVSSVLVLLWGPMWWASASRRRKWLRMAAVPAQPLVISRLRTGSSRAGYRQWKL